MSKAVWTVGWRQGVRAGRGRGRGERVKGI